MCDRDNLKAGDIIIFQKLQYLKDQAEVIRLFGEKSQNIWKNVVIIAKEGKAANHSLNFQVKKQNYSKITLHYSNVGGTGSCERP